MKPKPFIFITFIVQHAIAAGDSLRSHPRLHELACLQANMLAKQAFTAHVRTYTTALHGPTLASFACNALHCMHHASMMRFAHHAKHGPCKRSLHPCKAKPCICKAKPCIQQKKLHMKLHGNMKLAKQASSLQASSACLASKGLPCKPMACLASLWLALQAI